MFKIGLILLAFIAMVGTTTHYAFANNMGGPSVQPLCSTDTGGGMNMAPNTSDQGSGGGGGSSSQGPSDTTTSPGAGGGGGGTADSGGGISPGDRMSQLRNWGIEVIGPDQHHGHHHFGQSCINCHYGPGSEHFGSSETRGLFHHEEGDRLWPTEMYPRIPDSQWGTWGLK